MSRNGRDDTVQRLEERIVAQEADLAGLRRQLAADAGVRSLPGRRLLPRLVVALALAVMIAAPVAVVASHDFSDVPDGHTFHEDVSRIYDARITVGCGPDEYCPDDFVTRGQMAAFLARTGGRIAWQEGENTVLTGAVQDLAVITIRAGSMSGGWALVKVDASFSGAISSVVGCPCQAVAFIAQEGGVSSHNAYVHLATIPITGGSTGYDSGATTLAAIVPTNVNQTFRLKAYVFGGTGTITGHGSMTAISAPFDEQGGSPLD